MELETADNQHTN